MIERRGGSRRQETSGRRRPRSGCLPCPSPLLFIFASEIKLKKRPPSPLTGPDCTQTRAFASGRPVVKEGRQLGQLRAVGSQLSSSAAAAAGVPRMDCGHTREDNPSGQRACTAPTTGRRSSSGRSVMRSPARTHVSACGWAGQGRGRGVLVALHLPRSERRTPWPSTAAAGAPSPAHL